MRLSILERGILERVDELRAELARYQQSVSFTQARADRFAETYLDPLISDITDLKMNQPLERP